MYSHRQPALVRILDNRVSKNCLPAPIIHEPDFDQGPQATSGVCHGVVTASVCILAILALTILSAPAEVRQAEQARTQIDCTTTKVIMTDEAGSKGSVQVEERMTFWIDDAAKTFVFSDGRRLRVTRFDKSWISANSEDIQYEFNRADGTLTYAGSTTRDNITTTIVGSGRCENAST